jgi:hypothetical protein
MKLNNNGMEGTKHLWDIIKKRTRPLVNSPHKINQEDLIWLTVTRPILYVEHKRQ